MQSKIQLIEAWRSYLSTKETYSWYIMLVIVEIYSLYITSVVPSEIRKSLTPFNSISNFSKCTHLQATWTQGTKVLLSRNYGSNYGLYGKTEARL